MQLLDCELALHAQQIVCSSLYMLMCCIALTHSCISLALLCTFHRKVLICTAGHRQITDKVAFAQQIFDNTTQMYFAK